MCLLKCKFLQLIVFSCFSCMAYGQVLGYFPIDTSLVRCQYIYDVQQDSTDETSVKRMVQVLQIGKRISCFFDWQRFKSDSITIRMIKEGYSSAEITKKGLTMMGGATARIYKDHANQVISYFDRIPFDNYMYEENWEKPDWKLVKGDIQTICGHACYKAEAYYRGRYYTAWYTLEIPVSEGPWKFGGLPGLILKISDAKEQISFVCINVEKPYWNDPVLKRNPQNLIITDRLTFLKAMQKFMDNPGKSVSSSPLMMDNKLHKRAFEPRPYNPIELE